MPFTMLGKTIKKIGIIGANNLGIDIALNFYQNLYTYDVSIVIFDKHPNILEKALKDIHTKIANFQEKEGLKKEDIDRILNYIKLTNDYNKLFNAELIIETYPENMDKKQSIFDQFEDLCSETTILATNSSRAIPEEIFQRLRNKKRSLLLHYFLPIERNQLIEIIPSNETDPQLIDYMVKFYEFIGKVPIKVNSRYGHAVDIVVDTLLLASLNAIEKGIINVKQADAIAKKSLGMEFGSFSLQNIEINSITNNSFLNAYQRIMLWFYFPKTLDDQIKSGRPWDVAQKGETVDYSEEAYESFSQELMSSYFGIACELIDSNIITISDLETAIDVGLLMNPPFSMMNRIGVRKALEMVENYARENRGFKVAGILKKQAGSYCNWKIPYVLREDRKDISIVKIRRPRVLNALNDEVVEQLREIFIEIQKDSKIKGAILTGFGTRAFVSGAVIGMLASQKTPEDAEATALRIGGVLNLIENLGKPVVCALNGLAFGGGNELAMACATRIAKKGQKTLIGQPEPRLGIIPGGGGTQRLPRLIGIERAWPILRTANPISSSQAKEYGLIYDEVEGDLIEAAIGLLENIISGKIKIPPIPKGPIPIPEKLPEVDIGHLSRKIDSLLQKAILEGARMTLEEGLKLEAKLFGQCWLTKDMRIGMENFMRNGPKVNAKFIHE